MTIILNKDKKLIIRTMPKVGSSALSASTIERNDWTMVGLDLEQEIDIEANCIRDGFESVVIIREPLSRYMSGLWELRKNIFLSLLISEETIFETGDLYKEIVHHPDINKVQFWESYLTAIFKIYQYDFSFHENPHTRNWLSLVHTESKIADIAQLDNVLSHYELNRGPGIVNSTPPKAMGALTEAFEKNNRYHNIMQYLNPEIVLYHELKAKEHIFERRH